MDELEDMMKPAKVFFLDTNLSSPVLTTELDATKQLLIDLLVPPNSSRFFEFHESRRDELFFLRKLCRLKGWKANDIKTMTQVIPEMYPQLEDSMKKSPTEYESLYEDARIICGDIEEALCSGLKARGLPEQEVRGTMSVFGTKKCIPYRIAYEEFSDFFGRAESRVKTSSCAWTRGAVGELEMWMNANYALLKYNGAMYYSSPNQLLMLKDKVATRYMLLEHVLPLGLEESLLEHLTDLFKWQDDTLKLYGNQAYNILKAVEPMFKTRLSHVVDNIFGNDTAYTRMISKMDEKEEKIRKTTGITGHNKMKDLRTVVEKVKTIRNIVEMFGCLKSCGHPIIDPSLGGLSAAEEARSGDQTKLHDAQTLRNMFCHTILVSYVKQRGVWPRLTHMKPGTALRRLNDRQERNITTKSYPMSDWTTTEWTKIMDFDFFPNFLELMDDKSISFYRSQKNATWDRDVKLTSQRRLLLEVLHRKHIDIEEIVRLVSSRRIPLDWFIVSLYPKEREFKIDPRMFAMLVLEMRCFFTAIEANIADGLFKFLPQQTMTKTKTQNQERFLNFTDPTKNSEEYTLFLEIDLTRWNLRWRQLVIHMLGHDLNMMFGMPGTFTVTHWFFEKSQILVRVPGLRPEGIELPNPPTSSLAWTDHLGGFEGLNQKLWTTATYAMVDTGMQPLIDDGTIKSYELIGQGDNQVIRVGISSSSGKREDIIPGIRDRINKNLEEACNKVNQIVKPDENIESTSVLTYSKDVYVKGVEYPTSLKKHSRLFPVTSMDFPSVTSNARAILSDSVAGGENALYPLRSAIIGCYHAARYLLSAGRGRSIHGRDYPRLTIRDVIASLVLPSSIGGLAGVNMASFFYKGGSDPLGKEISSLRFLAEGKSVSSQLSSQALRALEEKYCVSLEPDLETLIDNPYGLPLTKPTSPLSKVGKLTLDAFRPKVNNSEIKPLLQKDIAQAESDLKKDLIKIEPLNPLMIHDLYEASGFGTIKLMRKMFIHTRTVQSVAQWVNPNITHTFLRADLNDTVTFLTWVKGLPQRGYSGRQSFDLVKQFRSYWGKELHGVTTHQPLDFIHSANTTRSRSSVKWSAHSKDDLLATRGPLSGYLGTATREKRSEHGYKIVDTGAPSRSVNKLQLIRSQAYGSKEFNELIDRISLTRSPIRLSDITEFLPKVIGGSIVHRLASVMRSMAASYVGPLNFVTHIRLDTDSIGEISGSALNYPVMLQEQIVMAQAAAKLLHVHTKAQSGEMLFDVDTLEALPDETLSCQEPVFRSASLPKSVLLYSDALKLTRTYDNVASAIPHYAVVKPTEYSDLKSIHESFVGFFVSTLRDQNRAKQIADTRGHASIPSRYQTDIAEIHAFGPINTSKAIAEAIVLTTIRDTFRTLQIHPERWDEALFMAHNVLVCVKSCASYWSHPLFQSHKDYSVLRHSQLSYSKKYGQYPRVEAQVRRQISRIMTDVEHPFWKHEIPVFAGENQTQIAEAVTIAGAKAILRLKIMGDSKFRLYSSLYSGYMRLPKTSSLSSGNILELLRIRFVALANAVTKKGDCILANEFIKIGSLRKLRVYNDDLRTVMRNARSLRPDIRQPIVAELRPSISEFSNASDHCLMCLPSSTSVNTALWNRYVQRKNGGLVSSGYTWLPLITSLTVSNSTLIVGNGNGGLADLLISCFGTNVIGIDLESDMPKETATLLNYVPSGIQSQNRSKFIQSDLSITTSGDWTDNTVRNQVLNHLPSVSTVIIDATGPSPESLLEAIFECMEAPKVSRTYSRLIGLKQNVLKVTEDLRKKYETRLWVVSHSHSSIEVIIEVSRCELPLHICSSKLTLVDQPITPNMHSVIPSRYGELLEAATNYSISWNGESLYEARLTVINMCTSLLNKPKSKQLAFKNRYGLILACGVLDAATSDYPLAIVQDWISEESMETESFIYQLNSSTITHLIKYVARLSNFPKDSHLFFS